MKKTKINSITYTKTPWEPTRYYFCIACGHHGDLGKVYHISKNCEKCNYDDIAPYSESEILEDGDLTLSRFTRCK